MDSRAYVFIFPIRTPENVPVDFRAVVQGRTFDTGVFLPQDDTQRFSRLPAYPARLLLLNHRRLSILSHPASGEAPVDLALDDLAQLETGNILLFGWVQLSTRTATHRLFYNTRASDPLERFVMALQRRWLCSPPCNEGLPPKIFGSELDIKFKNLLNDSLDHDEAVLLRYFVPPVERKTRKLIFRRIEFRSGHLLALTTGNRILWLRDEHKGHCERYAGITVSAPVYLLHSCSVQTISDRHELQLEFDSGATWKILIHDDGSECALFAQQLNAYASNANRLFSC